MNCKDLEELLSAYVDGELASTQRDFIEEHLASCADCRAALADYTKTREQLLSLRAVPPIPDIKQAIMSKIKMSEAPAKLRRWLRPALVGVPIIIILVTVLALHLSGFFISPASVIAKAYAASSSLESFRYVKEEYTQDSESAELVHSSHAEIEYTTPDRYRLVSEVLQSPFGNVSGLPDRYETIRIGDQVYVNIPFVFIKLEEEWFERLTPTKDKTVDFLNLLAEIETLEDESVDGTDCYHYIGEVDIDKFLELLRPDFERMYYRMDKSLPSGMVTDLEDWIENCSSGYLTQDMTFEFWIGEDDYLLRKAKLVYQTKEGEHSTWNKYRSIGIMNYYDFNEEIVIEPPLDGSGELLEGWVSYTIEPLEIPDEPTQAAETPAPRKPEGPQEIPEVFTKALSVTEKPETYRVMSKTYQHCESGWNHSMTSIYERGGDNVYHSLLEPTDEGKGTFPVVPFTMELVIIDDQIYTLNYLASPKSTEDYDDGGPTAEKTLKILEMLFDIETFPDEEINGTDCYHYRGILDAEKFLEWFYPVFLEDAATMKEISEEEYGVEYDIEQGWETIQGIYRTKEMIFEYWIGKDDYLIRKRILTERNLLENPLPLDDLSDESTRQVITEYYDFNEEIVIEAPLDESGELLEGWSVTTLEE